MRISDWSSDVCSSDLLLGPQSIATDLMSRNKKQLFRDLAERFAPIAGCNAETIVEVLAERERLGSTGFGGGVAIPHGKLEELDSLRAFLAVLSPPVAYGALVDMPVDTLCFLRSPRD